MRFSRLFFKKNISVIYITATVLIVIIIFYFYAESGFIRSILPPFFQSEAEECINSQILESDLLLLPYESNPQKFLPTFENIHEIDSMEKATAHIYNIEETAFVTFDDLNPKELLSINMKTELQSNTPKVLIFHTHSQEDFADSVPGEPNDTIVGVGLRLAEILSEKYGVSVVHDIGSYDMVNGKLSRGTSYENMEPAVKSILEKYPGIEVAIDLHRDGVPEHLRLTENINGKETAKIMFVCGITRYNDNGVPKELQELENPYVKENLALSLDLFLCANESYPGFARKNYIKPYRYSLHMLPKSMLVEVGANTSTVEEAMNAMEPLAEIIVKTLSK